MTIQISDRVSVAANVLAKELSGEVVLLDLTSGTYFGLDNVGARAWQLLAQGLTLAATCEQMATEYDVDRHTLEADVLALVNQLQQRALVNVQRS